MITAALDLDLLRGFATACRVGSVSRAAGALGRTQSALSMQLRRLEHLVGRTLLHRTGRGVTPTPAGELFLGYALRILALGEEAHARLHGPDLDGIVRIGIPEEVALAALPSALGRFCRTHPRVRLDVQVETTAALVPPWREGVLDVLVGAVSAVPDEAAAVWSVGLLWTCSASYEHDLRSPIDLIAFAEPCTWRGRMLEAVQVSGLAWRIGFTSPSVAAVQAAVENGLGVALLTPECIRLPSMRLLAHPALSDPVTVQYGLFVRRDQAPVVEAVMSALLQAMLGLGANDMFLHPDGRT